MRCSPRSTPSVEDVWLAIAPVLCLAVAAGAWRDGRPLLAAGPARGAACACGRPQRASPWRSPSSWTALADGSARGRRRAGRRPGRVAERARLPAGAAPRCWHAAVVRYFALSLPETPPVFHPDRPRGLRRWAWCWRRCSTRWRGSPQRSEQADAGRGLFSDDPGSRRRQRARGVACSAHNDALLDAQKGDAVGRCAVRVEPGALGHLDGAGIGLHRRRPGARLTRRCGTWRWRCSG